VCYTRDPGAYIGRGIFYLNMSIIFGIIYLDLRTDGRTQSHVLDYSFCIAWAIATPSYMATMTVPVFTKEKEIFQKETKNGMYSPLAYVASAALVQLLFVFATTSFSVIPGYWMDDLNDDSWRFFQFLLLMYSFLYTIESLCALVSAFIPNFLIALAFTISLLSNFFVMNGFFVQPEDVPWVLRWIVYISPHNYTQKGLAWIIYADTTFEACTSSDIVCYGTSGNEILDSLQSYKSDYEVGVSFAVLWGMSFFLRSCQWYVLRNE